MNTGLIPVRYASALLDFAESKSVQHIVYEEAKMLITQFNRFSQLSVALENPVLSIAEKRGFIVLATGNKISETFDHFLSLLFENNRQGYLHEIVLKYVDLYRRKNNIFHCRLTTATVTEPEVEKKLVSLVENTTGGKVEFEKITDPEIIGGFLFEVDFMRWDASISGQLRRIKQEYIDINKKTV